MKLADGWWFPEHEQTIIAAMRKTNVVVDGRLTWQYHKYVAARALCRLLKRTSVALDIGAHVGLFSYYMAQDFEEVAAFEPWEEHRRCWRRNMLGEYKAVAYVYDCALGAEAGAASLLVDPMSSGGTYVRPGDGPLMVQTLDSFEYPVVDLIKIDVEGFEPAVIAGAIETLQRCKPVVLVEQHVAPTAEHASRYGYTATQAVDQLTALGMTVRTQLGSDVLLWWGE